MRNNQYFQYDTIPPQCTGDMSDRRASQYDTIPQCAGDMYERKAGQYDTIPPQCALRRPRNVTKY